MDLNTTSIVAVIVFTSVALATDLKNRCIPNWITVTAAVLGLVWHGWHGGVSGVGTSLGGFATGFGILLVLWLTGGGGGGDVKMMGAVGAWLGALPTLIVFIASAGFAIVCTIAIIAWRMCTIASTVPAEGDDDAEENSIRRMTVPYALPVAMSIWALLVFHSVN